MSVVLDITLSLLFHFLLWSCLLLADKAGTHSATLTPTVNSHKTKRSVIAEQFVETAIVADKTMLQYHKRENLESYLFSLMNVVSDVGRVFIRNYGCWSHDHQLIT